MPVIEINQDTLLGKRSNYELEVERDPTFVELSKAHFENENLIVNIANKFARPERDPDDDDYDALNDIEGYEGHAERFIDVESRMETWDVKRRIDTEMETKATMQAGGVQGVAAGFLTGLVDPTMMIPLGGAAYTTYRSGGRILHGAAKTGLATGTVVAASETALQQLQETRTGEESLFNIAGATFLGGVVGGGSSAFASKSHLADLARRVDEEDLNLNHVGELTDTSVGAAVSPTTTLSQETLKSAAGLEKVLSFQDPVLRTLNSPSLATRKLSEQLVETPLNKTKHFEGIASDPSVENMVKSYNLPKYTYYKNRDELFKQYRQAKNVTVTKAQDTLFKRARRDGKLTYNEFKTEIARANRRGDTHEVPEIAAAAQAKRRDVLDPLFEKAKKVGLIDEDVGDPVTALSYLNRLWDHDMIKNNLPEFRALNAKWLREKTARMETKMNNLIAEDAAKHADEIEKMRVRISKLEGGEEDVAYQLTDRILGTPGGRLSYDLQTRAEVPKGGLPAGKRGPAKSRVYDIPDEMVERFLINDDDFLTEAYIHSLSSDIELMGKFGTLDPEDMLKQIQDDYQRLGGANKKPDVARKLKEAQDNDMRDFKAMWERIRGVYGHNASDDYASLPSSLERTAMNWNYLAMLGGMTLSAFPDVARPVMVNGVKNVFGDGVMAMATDWKGFKAAASEILEAGTALDMALHSRARAIAGFDEHVPFANRVEGVVGRAAHDFGVVSLMSPWNAGMKQFAGVVTQSRFLRAANKLGRGKKVSPKEIENLAANFIDEKMAIRIAKQFDEFGDSTGKTLIPNARAWTDLEAQKRFRAAIRREVDKTIVTPGQDKPLWMSKSGWRLMGQFRSFSVASTQRTMLAGLQQRDAAVLNGLALTVGLGSMVYVLKSKAAGYEPNYDLANVISEGIDRGGITGWLMDANNIVEKVSRGRVGVHPLIGGPPMSRYASRSALEAVFGPTYGQLGNALQITGSAFAGDWKATDTHTVRRMMPYQNLIYMRSIIDEAEKTINATLGVPGR